MHVESLAAGSNKAKVGTLHVTRFLVLEDAT
jgi:hypothetical protein